VGFIPTNYLRNLDGKNKDPPKIIKDHQRSSEDQAKINQRSSEDQAKKRGGWSGNPSKTLRAF
jgi:hypothetical protein